MKYRSGFRMLTPGWSDGNSFVPVNHCLLSAAEDNSLLCGGKVYDGRSFAGKRRLQARRKSTDVIAGNAHAAIVLSRYMMLSAARRENEDDKTICELCFCLLDEMEDITFNRSMCIIIEALMDAVIEYFHITETQLEEFTASFITRLPKYMQKTPERKESAA